MKIINTESGKPYQLNPGTELSIERTNPFFNDYGEQTLPVSLPDSEYNRTLLGNPGMTQRKDKVQMVDASIQDGNFYSVCRQAILSVTQGESIETSFYMNEGSFYSRLEDVYITDVFGDETVPGITTVDQAIEWMRQLCLSGGNEHFACCPVNVRDGDNEFVLNYWQLGADNFYHSVDRAPLYRRGVSGQLNMFVSKGFYLTPFIKANYILTRLFSYFGYTLLPNFFTETEQFRNMVFLNNIADAIVLGTIKISQLIPKVTCKEILELFRRKFCCEYVVDEYAKTVSIVLMNEIIDDNVKGVDLSNYLVGKVKLSYPDSYQQIILKATGSVNSDTNPSLDSLPMIRTQHPTAQFSKEKGCFYCNGIKYNDSNLPTGSVTEIVAGTSQTYYEGGNLPTLSVDIPETIPSTSLSVNSLYIGNAKYLNSSMVQMTADSSESVVVDEDNSSSESEMGLMLAFVYRLGSYTGGTVTNYGFYSPSISVSEKTERLGDYALIYNGDDGIFERFYRKYDTLLRNSLHQVEAELKLPLDITQKILATDKVNIKGIDYLINSLKFNISGSKLTEADLLTLNLYSPVSNAKQLNDIIPPLNTYGLKWEIHKSRVQITKEEYENSLYKDVELPTFFPPVPTPNDVGKQCYVRYIAIFIDAAHAVRPVQGDSWWLITNWLEAVAE